MANEKIAITLSKDEIEHVNRDHDEFHYAYGITMATWAGVERALFYWFFRVTRLNEGMARVIFYSSRSFNGRAEMLQAAIAQAELTGEQSEFIKAATKKAWAYNGFRNRLAHGEPIMNIIQRRDPKTAQTSRDINWSIVQGKTNKPDPEAEISIKSLSNAAENFHRLQELMIDALKPNAPLEQYLQRVGELPNRADFENLPDSASTMMTA